MAVDSKPTVDLTDDEAMNRTLARIERLRTRVKAAREANKDDPIPGIIMGILDLLGDEL